MLYLTGLLRQGSKWEFLYYIHILCVLLRIHILRVHILHIHEDTHIDGACWFTAWYTDHGDPPIYNEATASRGWHHDKGPKDHAFPWHRKSASPCRPSVEAKRTPLSWSQAGRAGHGAWRALFCQPPAASFAFLSACPTSSQLLGRWATTLWGAHLRARPSEPTRLPPALLRAASPAPACPCRRRHLRDASAQQ